jgi:hypothetical protein
MLFVHSSAELTQANRCNSLGITWSNHNCKAVEVVCTGKFELYTISFFTSSPISMPDDFPCVYPSCNHTFTQLSSRTQHYNAVHCLLSPDAEPDPALEFNIRYHPKLNGMWPESSITLSRN